MKTTLYFGIGCLLLGLYLFFNPLVSIASIAWIVAFIITVMGLFNLRTYLSLEKQYQNNWLLLQSLIKIILGLILLTSSALSLSQIVMSFIGLGFLIVGAISLKINNRFNKQLSHKTSMTGSSLVIFLLGIVFLLNPSFSAGVIGYFLSLLLMIIGAIFLIIYYQQSH
ncbi:DUF308 domain-containing protein [Streptococcus sp. CSL10205-OR2]|uniref:DUF308 domain-containing protein n=1 Tax=Streptococcus sp. CSL10205-OR2 TaxID=2980558 RepID=UPI0021DB013F|nr:DUF308 domain-containing protein [Streptococcus sp. CSL10205-OR2]MCU9534432.1 DUF308 domain-containing protein [Streptococcus sp. CSL10205-OR2]